MHGRRVAGQPRLAVEQVAARLMEGERLAQDRLVALAIEAVAAMRVPGADDVIARRDVGDVLADRLDHARAFVAEHDRHRIGERAVDHLEVGVAEAARHDPHQHVAALQPIDPRAADLERPADRRQDRGVEFDHRLTIAAGGSARRRR